MPTLRDALLPIAQLANQLGTDFGVNRYAVTVRTRTWSGPRVGEPPAANSDLAITPNPEVTDVSIREVLNSGGRLQAGDQKILGIPPRWTDGSGTHGYTPAQLNPVPGTRQDVRVVLVGDDGTKICTIVDGKFDDPLGYELTVRVTRETP